MMRQSFAAVLSAFVVLCSLATPAEARREWQAFGGSGDAQNKIACPAGQVLVGFQGAGGAWVNQLRIVCAPLTGEFATGDPRPVGEFVGIAAGFPIEAICPRNSVVGAFNFNLSPDKRMLARIVLTCNDANGGAGEALFNPQSVFEGDSDRTQVCPQEQLVGVTVHYGRNVNAIGAICDRREMARAAAPPPPAAAAPPLKPIHTTGGGRGAPRPMANFLGQPWSVVAKPGTPFRLVFHEDEGPGAMWAEMLFADARLNGTAIGKVSDDGKVFTFTYEQPQTGVSGSGSLKIYTSRVMGGHVTTDQDGQSIEWAGHN